MLGQIVGTLPSKILGLHILVSLVDHRDQSKCHGFSTAGYETIMGIRQGVHLLV